MIKAYIAKENIKTGDAVVVDDGLIRLARPEDSDLELAEPIQDDTQPAYCRGDQG